MGCGEEATYALRMTRDEEYLLTEPSSYQKGRRGKGQIAGKTKLRKDIYPGICVPERRMSHTCSPFASTLAKKRAVMPMRSGQWLLLLCTGCERSSGRVHPLTWGNPRLGWATVRMVSETTGSRSCGPGEIVAMNRRQSFASLFVHH